MKTTFLVSFAVCFLISCTSFPNLGSGYQLNYNSSGFSIITDSLGRNKIKAHIENYKFDNNFIIAYQKPIDSICECNIECFNKMESYDGKTVSRCKKAFRLSKLHYYWIINKNQPSVFNTQLKRYSNVFGPYTYQEFLIEATNLGVPYELTISF